MIEHWRISAVYFTCNQVDEAVKTAARVIAVLQRSEERRNTECKLALAA